MPAICICTLVTNKPILYWPLAYLYMRSLSCRCTALFAICTDRTASFAIGPSAWLWSWPRWAASSPPRPPGSPSWTLSSWGSGRPTARSRWERRVVGLALLKTLRRLNWKVKKKFQYQYILEHNLDSFCNNSSEGKRCTNQKSNPTNEVGMQTIGEYV